MKCLKLTTWFHLLFLLCLTGCVSNPGKTNIGQESNILRVGVSANYPPIVYKNGEDIVGLEVELGQTFADEIRKTVQFIEISWENQIQALLDKKIDIIMSGMSITEERKVRVAFTRPYLKTGQLALVRKKELEEFSLKESIVSTYLNVGVVKGTTGAYLVEDKFGNAKVVHYTSANDAVRDLKKGTIDIFIHDAPSIWWLAAQKEGRELAATRRFLTDEYLAWAIHPHNDELRTAANDFIRTSAEYGQLKTMIEHWMPYRTK